MSISASLPRVARLLLLLCLVPLAACALFSPPFDPQVGNPTTLAYQEAMQLVAEAEYGRFADRATFDAAAQRYAEADAQLATAKIRAEAGDTGRTRLSRRAAALLPEQISGCRDQLKRLAGIHQRTGIAPDAGLTGSVVVACDLAARAANGMASE
jgi:hypothetical protein